MAKEDNPFLLKAAPIFWGTLAVSFRDFWFVLASKDGAIADLDFALQLDANDTWMLKSNLSCRVGG